MTAHLNTNTKRVHKCIRNEWFAFISTVPSTNPCNKCNYFLKKYTQERNQIQGKTHRSIEFQHEATLNVLLCRLATTSVSSRGQIWELWICIMENSSLVQFNLTVIYNMKLIHTQFRQICKITTKKLRACTDEIMKTTYFGVFM